MSEQRDDKATRRMIADDNIVYTRRVVDSDGTEKRGSEIVSNKQVEVDTQAPPPPPPPPSGEE